MAMLMAIGTCAIAASAASDIQNAIDAAASSYTLTSQAVGSIVINGKNDFTLDLNGYELVSDSGAAAITIKNSNNVTIKNGQVFSYTARKGWEDTFNMIQNGTSPAAITVIGSTVRLEGVRADAGRTYVPHATGELAEWAIPTGSAIQASNNSVVTLAQVSAVGDYAVYNSGAQVVVEDAILLGYIDAALNLDAVSSAEGSEKVVNAADRITGFLNPGITLETYEMDLLKKVMGKRALIFTKTPEEADVTITNGKKLEVEADEQSFLWEKGAGGLGTDCSYKYVPEYLVLADGTRYALNTDGTLSLNGDFSAIVEEDEATWPKVTYRLMFELQNDIKELISEYDKIDTYYAQGIQMVKDLWYDHSEPRGEDFMGAWTYYTGRPVYVDDASAKPYSKGVVEQAYNTLKGVRDDVYRETKDKLGVAKAVDLMDNAQFKAIMVDLFELAGSRLEADKLRGEKIPGVSKLSDSAYGFFYGLDDATLDQNVQNAYVNLNNRVYDFTTAEIPAGVNGQKLYVYGLLDKIGLIVNDMDAYMANIDDMSTFKDIAYFVYGNLDSLLEMVDEAEDKLGNLLDDIDAFLGDNADYAKQFADINDTIAEVRSALNQLSKANSALDDVLNYDLVKKAFAKLDRQSEATLKYYVDKAVYMFNNRDTYFTPDKFLVEGGNFGKTYSVVGDSIVDFIKEGEVKLDFTQSGAADPASKVTLTIDGDAQPAAAVDGETYYFNQEITLTASAAGNDEFLYWVNKETNRVVSTLETLTFNTKVNRDIVAEFVQTYDTEFEEARAIMTFTNTTGARVGTVAFDPAETSVDFADELGSKTPFLPGYTFEKWGYQDGSAIDLDAAAADANNKYVAGNSMFESTSKFYDEKGYALPVRTGSDSVIVTPKFSLSNSEPVHVTFLDPATNTRYNAEMKYGYTTTVTAEGSNFSYWKDADTNEIVSFNPSFTYQSIGNMVSGNISTNFVAVYGAPTSKFYASRAIVSETSDKYTLYVQRTVKAGYSINTNGVVISFTNSEPEVNAADSLKSTAKDNSANGLYVVAIPKSFIPNGVVYVRPYAEINGEVVYGTMQPITL